MNLVITNVMHCYVSAGCHINDVMNNDCNGNIDYVVSAGCHINDVMNTGNGVH